MKKSFKLLFVCIAILMMACLVVACDFDGDNCNHDFVEKYREESCTGNGKVYLECSKCGYPSSEKLPPVGHEPVSIEAVNPTCTTSGSTAGTKCAKCGEYVVAPQEIPAQHTTAILPVKPA